MADFAACYGSLAQGWARERAVPKGLPSGFPESRQLCVIQVHYTNIHGFLPCILYQLVQHVHCTSAMEFQAVPACTKCTAAQVSRFLYHLPSGHVSHSLLTLTLHACCDWLLLLVPPGSHQPIAQSCCGYEVLIFCWHALQVQVHVINPLALSNNELYGSFDEGTHEWQDGVLARIMRTVCKDESPDQKWILFDGPVDTLWIESMNTLLDDNKLLTLLSGERISMSPQACSHLPNLDHCCKACASDACYFAPPLMCQGQLCTRCSIICTWENLGALLYCVFKVFTPLPILLANFLSNNLKA